MTALFLSLLSSLKWKSGVGLSMSHFIAIRLSGKNNQQWLDSYRFSITFFETNHEIQCGFFLNIVVGEGPAIFELHSFIHKALLNWRNYIFILDCSWIFWSFQADFLASYLNISMNYLKLIIKKSAWKDQNIQEQSRIKM